MVHRSSIYESIFGSIQNSWKVVYIVYYRVNAIILNKITDVEKILLNEFSAVLLIECILIRFVLISISFDFALESVLDLWSTVVGAKNV